VDVGCGNGQLTVQLAQFFNEVTGLDPSADQIANIAAHERVRYLCAPAENIPLPDRCADLITAAQAAHWFDLPRFYDEVRRIARPGGIVALISYGVLQLEPAELDRRFTRFYWQEIGPYWPPERKLVDSGYADIPFPFIEFSAPAFSIERSWKCGDFLGYISTWSATQRAIEAGREDVLENFAADLSALWGPENQERFVRWPVNMRLGRI
jgi:SAM-dependent methyltransferase